MRSASRVADERGAGRQQSPIFACAVGDGLVFLFARGSGVERDVSSLLHLAAALEPTTAVDRGQRRSNDGGPAVTAAASTWVDSLCVSSLRDGILGARHPFTSLEQNSIPVRLACCPAPQRHGHRVWEGQAESATWSNGWYTAVWAAAVVGNLPMVVHLLRLDELPLNTPEAIGYALHGFASSGHADAFLQLLSLAKPYLPLPAVNGVTVHDRQLLHAVVQGGSLPIVRALTGPLGKELGFDATRRARKYNETALHMVSRTRGPDPVGLAAIFLDQLPMEIDDQDSDGWTPLHWAAYDNQYDLFKYLLSRGADVHALTNDWQNMINLNAPMAHDDRRLIAFLLQTNLDFQLDVNQRDASGLTPLLSTCFSAEYDETARLLIANGADVNSPHPRRSLLHVATEARLLSRVQMLVQAGANVAAVDEFGLTPEQVVDGMIRTTQHPPTLQHLRLMKAAFSQPRTLASHDATDAERPTGATEVLARPEGAGESSPAQGQNDRCCVS